MLLPNFLSGSLYEFWGKICSDFNFFLQFFITLVLYLKCCLMESRLWPKKLHHCQLLLISASHTRSVLISHMAIFRRQFASSQFTKDKLKYHSYYHRQEHVSRFNNLIVLLFIIQFQVFKRRGSHKTEGKGGPSGYRISPPRRDQALQGWYCSQVQIIVNHCYQGQGMS